MIVFFEIPIIAIVMVIAAVLGIKVGMVLTVIGVLGLLIGLLFTWATKDDETDCAISIFLFVIPNIILLIAGLAIGDQMLFDLIF